MLSCCVQPYHGWWLQGARQRPAASCSPVQPVRSASSAGDANPLIPRPHFCAPLQLGAGVAADQRLSLELYRRAAELGDAEAQGKMGMRYALGLHNTSSFEGAAIKRFGQVRCWLAAEGWGV